MPSYGNDVTLVPAGTVVTATGNGAGIELNNKGTFNGQVIVTAASGTTPSDTIAIQTSHDNGVLDPWRTIASFPAVTAVGSSVWKGFSGVDRWIRATHTVTGTTPSLTLSVVGEAF
jgi:hypothetical protein